MRELTRRIQRINSDSEWLECYEYLVMEMQNFEECWPTSSVKFMLEILRDSICDLERWAVLDELRRVNCRTVNTSTVQRVIRSSLSGVFTQTAPDATD